MEILNSGSPSLDLRTNWYGGGWPSGESDALIGLLWVFMHAYRENTCIYLDVVVGLLWAV